MRVDAIGGLAAPYSLDAISPLAAIGKSGDNEKTERIPDTERMEVQAKKAPLANYQGRTVDMTA